MENETQTGKQTLEQFGSRIREKYPEYLKFSNKEIAEKVIAKYPQYRDKISDLPEVKQPGFFERAGKTVADIFTGQTQKLGRTLGQIGASEEVIPALEQSAKTSSDIELQLIKQIRKAKAEGRDTSRLQKALTDISGRQKTGELIQETIPGAMKSNRQVIGEIVGTTTEALSGGVVSGTRGIGLAKVAPTATAQAAQKAAFLSKPLSGRLRQIGAETLKDVATLAPFGYAYDVAQKLQEDKTGMEAFKPGVATIMSTIIPLGIGGVRAGRQITADTLSNVVAPNLSGVQSEAFKRLRTGNVDIANAPSAQQALDEARATASAFKQAMQKEFGEGQEKLIVEMTGKRIGLPENEISKLTRIAERFGFEDRLPQNMQNMSVKETMDLLKEINSVPIIKDIDDPLVRNLKLNLAEIKNSITSKGAETFTNKFSNLYQTYSKKAGLLKNLQSVIGKVGVTPNGFKLNPTQKQTATARLQKIFNEDGIEYLNTIKQLEKETGQNIVDRVAASQLVEKLPETLRRVKGFDAQNKGGFINSAISLLTLPLSSPRAASFIISQIGGYGRGTVTKLLNANPKLREAVYNAVVDKNMKFSDAVELYMKDFIQNPKLGLSIEDVSKKAGSVSDDLMKEARKYKSAEEFVKAQLDKNSFITKKPIKVYRGEGKGIGNETLVSGRYFADSKDFAKNFGEVTTHEIPEGVKIFDLDTIKYGNNSMVSDTSLVNPQKLTDFLMDNGFEYTKNTNSRGVEYVKLKRYAESESNRNAVNVFEGLNNKFGDLVEKYKTKESFANNAIKRAETNPEKYGSPAYRILTEFFENVKSGNIPKINKINSESQLEEIWKKANQVEKPAIPAYKGEKDLTTKILKDLEGKTTVSKQYILDATNRPELKQVERDLIRDLVKNEPDTINVSDFAKKVKVELLPLKVKTTSNPKGSDPKFFREQTRGDAQYGGARMQPRYEMVNLPDELRGNVKNYRENIYESPIKTSAGETHFGGKTDNYFGHTRIEDMADNKTRRVIEVQSDLYQKGRLEDSVPFETKTLPNEAKRLEEIQSELYKIGDNTSPKAKKLNAEKAEIRKVIDSRPDPKATNLQKLQQYNDPTAHFRMIREEIKKASLDGKTKLQFPTGETAMKIEGLGQSENNFRLLYDDIETPAGLRPSGSTKLTPEKLSVGERISQGEGYDDQWIITDVIGDGKFKAVPKETVEKYGGLEKFNELPGRNRAVEEFDISGKVDTNNPIYKFYEKDVQKYLNKFGGKRVVDENGVSWIEVPIKKEWAQMPVEAFAIIGGVGLASQNNNN